MNPIPRPKFPTTLLILVLALAGLYARSYRRADVVGVFVGGGRLQVVASSRGRFVVAVTNVSLGDGRRWTWDYTAADTEEAEAALDELRGMGGGSLFTSNGNASGLVNAPASPAVVSPPPPFWERLGFVFGRTSSGSWTETQTPEFGWIRFAAIPQWVLSPLVLVLLVRLLRRRRFRVRAKRGLCPYCGYDLRGNSGRCSECGSDVVFKKNPTSAAQQLA